MMPNVSSYLAVSHNRFQHRTRVHYYGTSNQYCFSVESIMVVPSAGKRERDREREREKAGGGVQGLRPVSDCNVFTGRIVVRVDTLTLMGHYH